MKRGAEAYAAGRLSTKQLPPPSRGSQRTLPPWRSAICRTRPGRGRRRRRCSAWPGRRKKGSKMRSRVGLGHARAAVADAQLGLAGGSRCTRDADLVAAVAARVLEQVAQRAAQQPFVAGHLHRARRRPRHRRARPPRRPARAGRPARWRCSARAGVEPAGQQHLLDQRVELGDVGVDLARRLSRCAGAASSSIDTAIFMRASGERSSWLALASRLWCERTSASMRAAARLKLAPSAATSSRPSSATRWLQRAGAEGLDALLQRLEPARQPAHHRVGAGGDRHEQHHQQGAPAQAAGRARRGHHGSGEAPAAPAARPAAAGASRRARATVHAGARPARPGAAAGRMTHSVRPSSSRTDCARRAARRIVRLAPQERLGRADARAARRRPAPAAGAAAATSRAAPRPARPAARRRRAASAAAARPRPPARSLRAGDERTRSWSRWRWNSQPETSANSSSTTTTVR